MPHLHKAKLDEFRIDCVDPNKADNTSLVMNKDGLSVSKDGKERLSISGEQSSLKGSWSFDKSPSIPVGTEDDSAVNKNQVSQLIRESGILDASLLEEHNKSAVSHDDIRKLIAAEVKRAIAAEKANAEAIALKANKIDNAIGMDSSAPWKESSAFGNEANASGNQSLALGYSSNASGNESVAVGWKAQTNEQFSVSLGADTLSVNSALALGYGARAFGVYSIALGTASVSNGLGSVAIGKGSLGQYNYSTALGYLAMALKNYSVALGPAAASNVYGSIAIGGVSTCGAEASESVALGYGAEALEEHSIALGVSSSTSSRNSVAVGPFSSSAGSSSVSVGLASSSSGLGSIALGGVSESHGESATALGNYSSSSGSGSMALGYLTNSQGSYSIALGAYAIASGRGSMSLGIFTNALGENTAILCNRGGTAVLPNSTTMEARNSFHNRGLRFVMVCEGKSEEISDYIIFQVMDGLSIGAVGVKVPAWAFLDMLLDIPGAERYNVSPEEEAYSGDSSYGSSY